MRNAASFIASQSGSAQAGILQSAAHYAVELLAAWKRRREVARLADFDDHMLADIGLNRRDVQDALDLPFSHDPGRELQARASHNRRHGWNS